MATSLIDNDILHKTTAYGLFDQLINLPKFRNEKFGILETSKYVILKKIKKNPPSCGAETGINNLKASLTSLEVINPTAEEIALAATFEYEALRQDLAFDTGESTLCAVLLTRGLNYFFTGDKRAIASLSELVAEDRIPKDIVSRVVCLEQIIMLLATILGISMIRERVCAEREVDRSLAICFSCSSPEIADSACLEGLVSYIQSLMRDAPTILASDS